MIRKLIGNLFDFLVQLHLEKNIAGAFNFSKHVEGYRDMLNKLYVGKFKNVKRKQQDFPAHLRCTACAEFTQRIREARGDQRAQVLRAQQDHINCVRQFRTCQTRMNALSEDATKPGRRDNLDEFLKIDLDACDEAKFKLPRNTASAKSLEKLWRPQLHLHGSLIWGVPCSTYHSEWFRLPAQGGWQETDYALKFL